MLATLRRFTTLWFLCGLVVAVVLLTSACGGDDDVRSASQSDVPEFAADVTSLGGQEALDELPTVEPASEDTEVPRATTFQKGSGKDVKGSQNMTVGQFLWWAARSSSSVWSQAFSRWGRAYLPSYVRLVDTNETATSRCDGGITVNSLSGPFYCPADWPCSVAASGSRGCGTIFLPTDWFVQNTFRPFGDFAAAWVVGHEWGHHIQDLLGILNYQATGRLKVIQTELQADCLAGVWSNSVYYQNLLEPGDVQEAARVAYALGDDLPWEHPQAHGTPTQRSQWFMYGYNTGDASRCKTY